jgi:hypothetical protein
VYVKTSVSSSNLTQVYVFVILLYG